jgi:hypothetical protein
MDLCDIYDIDSVFVFDDKSWTYGELMNISQISKHLGDLNPSRF